MLRLLGPVFVLIQSPSSVLASSFWELAGFGSHLCLHLALGSPGPGFPMFLELPVRQSLDSIPTTHTQREAEGPQSHRVRAREKEMQAGFPSKSQLHLTGKDNTL